MNISGKKISNKKINLDGNTFTDCDISKSVLVYKGGVLPIMQECRINDCQWSFAGEAANTLQFMASMYSGMGAGGKDLVDHTISNIRSNSLTTAPKVEAADKIAQPAEAANEEVTVTKPQKTKKTRATAKRKAARSKTADA